MVKTQMIIGMVWEYSFYKNNLLTTKTNNNEKTAIAIVSNIVYCNCFI